MSTPIALTIAGSDSSGGAGIQADLKAFSALGCYGASVITALTAQNTQGVTGIHAVPTDFITQQLEAVFSDLNIAAVKIGMLATPEVISTVAEFLTEQRRIKPDLAIVLDPVMVAKGGDKLLEDDAVGALSEKLVPLATVLTPNVPEAAFLLARDNAENIDEMADQGQALLSLGCQHVLVKGGRLSSDNVNSADLWINKDSTSTLTTPRIPTKNTHGTGCTLSAAIAAKLAHGKTAEEAIRESKDYVSAAIAAADSLTIGQGRGPVHHFYKLWDAV
ncbi:bifunctional hydroxymethylpyrimidine kinase/phosphomethylpyrimidine kinase [Leucothrix sargassi]|nr:bifunctional hydroxymethylpyrimidine kinase/phosphomethylpyrimidine kinase [Leucothrix sargassi]